MKTDNSIPQNDSQDLNRRDMVRKGAKLAYAAPLVFAAIKASERPAAGTPVGSDPTGGGGGPVVR